MSEAEKERHYGKDCPKGMVQVEFVSVSPELRMSDYGWKPSESASVDIYIDGQRFFIRVGDFEANCEGGKRRGLSIIGPMAMQVDKHSVNAFDVYLPNKPEST